MRIGTGLMAVLAAAATLVGCGGGGEPPAPPAPAVEVATPERRDVTSYYHYTGNLESIASVEVRARVSGELEAMHFEVSSPVEAGAKLFTIEPEAYDIAIQAAEASVQTAEAAVELATIERNQVQEAFDKQAANERELQKYITALKTAEAEKLAAEASLRDARLQREYADVTAPIAGRVSRNLVDVGTLVGIGEPTLLTTVVQMDPIYVYVDVSERIVQEYLNRDNNGEFNSDEAPPPPPIEIARSSDPPGQYPFAGLIDYVDNVVDESTGTLRVRGSIPNPEGRLFPGLFVRARVPYDAIPDAVVIREDALSTDLTGKFVLVVGKDNIIERRTVTLGDKTDDGLIVVTSGLDGSETYVTKGIQKARPGAPVTIRKPPSAPRRRTGAPPPTARKRGTEPMISRFFIDRPVFATVVAIIMMILGGVSVLVLPIEQYPDIAPPVVQVTASYPGADAQTVVDTVTAPLEQQLNGVEGMIYMKSTSTSEGTVTIDVTFELGTDPDLASVYTQNPGRHRRTPTARRGHPPGRADQEAFDQLASGCFRVRRTRRRRQPARPVVR